MSALETLRRRIGANCRVPWREVRLRVRPRDGGFAVERLDRDVGWLRTYSARRTRRAALAYAAAVRPPKD